LFGNTLKKFPSFALAAFLIFPVHAESCKQGPVIVSVSVPESLIVVDNSEALANRFGEVEAQFQNKLTLKTEKNGGCIALTGANAAIRYDFIVRIDKRFGQGSCEFEAALGHETDHIETYKSILFDFKDKLAGAIKLAARRVPANIAMDAMAALIQADPEFLLVLREMEMEADLRNRHIDGFDYFDYMGNCR
jgi:hypothetical protein